jgi:hypothetical protein
VIRHPEVAAKAASKDERPDAMGPSPFEAHFRSRLRVTGIELGAKFIRETPP